MNSAPSRRVNTSYPATMSVMRPSVAIRLSWSNHGRIQCRENAIRKYFDETMEIMHDGKEAKT